MHRVFDWFVGEPATRGQVHDEVDLRRPLFFLSPKDPWRLQDAVEGTIIFGATGSGKTSGSGETIAKSLLRAGCGGLVLSAKKDERLLWERYCRETGRELVIFSPSSGRTFNVLDYEVHRSGEGAGLTENLVLLFCEVLEVAERTSGGNTVDYWQRAVRQLLRNAIDLALISRGTLSIDLLHNIIVSSPTSPEELDSPSWQEASTCMACVREGEQKTKTAEEKREFEIAASFFLKEFATLNPRTRSCVVSTFTTMSDVFLRGVVHRLFCTTTNLLIPEATHEGKVVFLDLPVKEFNQVGQLVQVLIKYIWQRATERRDLTRYPKPCFLFADEAQYFTTATDAVFQTTARSSRAATVYLTQSLSNFYAAFGGERGKALTHSLLGNLQTKVFHANGDSVTNHYAAELFAKGWQWRGSAGMSTTDGATGEPRVSRNAGGSDSLEYEVLPQEFTTLRKGGPDNNGEVDSLIFSGGRKWRATGKNYIRAIFRQDAYETPPTMAQRLVKRSAHWSRQAFRLTLWTAKLLVKLLPPSLEVFLHHQLGARYFPRVAGSLALFFAYWQVAVTLPDSASNQAGTLSLTVYGFGFLGLALFHLGALFVRRLRGPDQVHSYGAGVPWLAWERLKLSTAVVTCFVEPVICFLLALLLTKHLPALAFWIKMASVALVMKNQADWWTLRRRALDATDARAEARLLTARIDGRPLPRTDQARRFVVMPPTE